MHKLKFKFKPGAMPRFGVEYTTCIGGCDEIFNDSMDIKLNNVRNTGRSNDSGYQSSNSTQRSSQSNSSSQRNNNATSSTNNSRSMSQARQQQSQGNSNNTVQFRQPENTRQQNGWSRQNNQETRTNVGMVTSNANSNSNISQNWGSVDDGSAILCNCHNPAIQLTVRKDGPNIGILKILLKKLIFNGVHLNNGCL